MIRVGLQRHHDTLRFLPVPDARQLLSPQAATPEQVGECVVLAQVPDALVPTGKQRKGEAMKNFGWIVVVGVIAYVILLPMFIDMQHDGERQEWRTAQDSLLSGWEKSRNDLADIRLYTDSLRAYTDSVAQTYPPEPVIIRRALKTFEYAPLGMAVDTLNAE